MHLVPTCPSTFPCIFPAYYEVGKSYRTRRTKAGTNWQAPEKGLGSSWERKRGTGGLVLPAKENARSQCSGCQPATACLGSSLSQDRRLLAINRLYKCF